jgi:hypothetical protein
MSQGWLDLLALQQLNERLKDELARNPFLAPSPRRPVRREQTLSAPTPERWTREHGHPDEEVWMAVIDIGHPDAVVTLVAIADGTTRVFFDGQGGVIRADQRPDVRRASHELLAAAALGLAVCVPVEAAPRPGVGRVAFYLRTSDAMRGTEASTRELTDGGHPMSPVYRAALSLLETVRDGSD